MLLGASGSFFTYEFRGRKITRFGNGLLSISADKSTNLSGSTDVLSVIADVVKDIDYDCSNRYNEIPGRTFLSESRHVPWIGGGKQYNYKFSPQCSLPFRRMDRDPRGYSRKVRNSPMTIPTNTTRRGLSHKSVIKINTIMVPAKMLMIKMDD
jgi:hypothetical protein